MQKWRPSEVFIMFFCKISQNSCLLILVTSISLNIPTVQKILFFDVFTIFCDFLNTKKGDPQGEGGWGWCHTVCGAPQYGAPLTSMATFLGARPTMIRGARKWGCATDYPHIRGRPLGPVMVGPALFVAHSFSVRHRQVGVRGAYF